MRLALLAIPAVRSALSLEINRDIEYHAAIASTQDRARALAASGSGPRVVVADRLVLFVDLTRELERVAAPSERQPALDEWRRRSTLLGREVEVTREGRPVVRGVARDIAEDGALLVESERVVVGDVRVIA